MVRRRNAVGTFGLGVLFTANPIYLNFIFEQFGIGWVSSPWLTATGFVYMSVGLVLVGVSFMRTELTFRSSLAISLVSLPAIGVYAFTTYVTGFSPGEVYSFVISDFNYWAPQLVPLALMLPLGVGTGRERVGTVLLILGVVTIVPFRIAFSPTGWNGPVALLLWFVIGILWAGLFGSPLSLIGRKTSDRTSQRGGPKTVSTAQSSK